MRDNNKEVRRPEKDGDAFTLLLGKILAESINGGRRYCRSRSATTGRIIKKLTLHFEAVEKLSEEEIASAMWDGELVL